MKTRREFIRLSVLSGAATFILPGVISCDVQNNSVPYWLSGLENDFLKDPNQAALTWFKDARYGMLIHYGLYSLLGRQEWVQFTEKIPVKAYEKLKDDFTAKNFDADFITDLLLESGMKYLNVMARHHDSFCLWDTGYSDFKSTNSPARRDLIGELSDQCNKKGIALFLSYSHGRDWRHPHAPNPDIYKSYSTRPAYEDPELYYKYGNEHDLGIYVEFAQNQVKELLSNYGNIAGISFGGASTILSGPKEPFMLPELYKIIRKLQPHALISYGSGVTGNEDVFTFLRHMPEKASHSENIEVCDTLQPQGWGYASEDNRKHKTEKKVMEMLSDSSESFCNLLLNTGPLPDGEIHPEDIATLTGVGKYIRRNGFPDSGLLTKTST